LRRPGPGASTTPGVVAAGLPALALGLAGLLAWAVVPVSQAQAATTPNIPAEAGLISANQRAAADRAKAGSVSAQIQSEGLLLAKYAERADAESVRSAQLDTRLRATRGAATSATEQVRTARSLLVAQAIAAYTNGGAFSYSPGTIEGTGLVVAAAYAEAVAQRQQLALSDYRRALARDKAVFSELSRQKASVRAATLLLTADRAAASAQQSSLRATLAGVKGDLAVAVADVERQQAAVQAEEEKAFLQSINQLPKATPLMAADRSAAAGVDRSGASMRGAASASAGPGQHGNENTNAAPTTSTYSASQTEGASGTVVIGTEAPTTAEPVPAPTPAPPSTTTSTAPAPTSAPTTTLAPTTTTVTSAPPSTTSTTATPLSSTTVVTTLSSVPSILASSTSSPLASTLASTTTAPPTSLATTTTAAPEDSGAAAGSNYSGSSGAGSSGAEPLSSSSAAGGGTSLTTTPTTAPSSASASASAGLPPVGGQVALAFAESQIGKPYQWGGAGPATYDCSGLVMVAWGKAGVSMPHSAQDQYDMTARVPLADLQPGDLVFFGTPTDVYHVGMYVGGGDMVDAPETGQDVMVQPIYELNLLAGGRPS
jgi:peptidoglycan DL-endopeptidase CwlO